MALLASATDVTSAFLKRFGHFTKENGTIIQNVAVIVFTLIAEEIFQRIVFRCPCHNPRESQLHGAMFLGAPAFILFVTGFLLNNNSWRLITGYYRSKVKYGCLDCSYYVTGILCESFVAPSAWIFMSLMDGSYYRCIRSENPCAHGHGNETVAKAAEERNQELLSQSQIIGWLFLVFIIAVAFIGYLTVRFFSHWTFDYRNYMLVCRQNEKIKFNIKTVEEAKSLAKRNVTKFFDYKHITKNDWDSIVCLPKESDKKTTLMDQSSNCYCNYSSLDRWSKHHQNDEKPTYKLKEKDNVACAEEELIPLNNI